MTVTLELPPELEELFLAEARAKGVPVADVIKAYLVDHVPPATEPEQWGPEQWEQEFERWCDGFPDHPPLSDAAISRESIYTREDNW